MFAVDWKYKSIIPIPVSNHHSGHRLEIASLHLSVKFFWFHKNNYVYVEASFQVHRPWSFINRRHNSYSSAEHTKCWAHVSCSCRVILTWGLKLSKLLFYLLLTLSWIFPVTLVCYWVYLLTIFMSKTSTEERGGSGGGELLRDWICPQWPAFRCSKLVSDFWFNK